MVIQVKKKNVYGNELIYPVNFIKELNDLTGKKTLDSRDINALKTLGLEFEVKQENLKI